MNKKSQKSTHKITAVIDTREKKPLDLEKYGLECVAETLPHGDYSLLVPDLRRSVCIERKTLPDFVACCTRERKRFHKELLALRGYQHSIVACEFTLGEVFRGEYRSKVKPHSILASIARWNSYGVQFLFAENADQAAWLVAKYLELVARDTIEIAQLAYLAETVDAP